MNAKQLALKEKEIQADIPKFYPPTEFVSPIFDGLADPEAYLKAPKRILWLMKEPYDADGGGWSLAKNSFAKDSDTTALKTLFSRICYITYGVFNGITDWWDKKMPYVHDSKDVRMTLTQIAYVNINKLPAKSRSHAPEIAQAYEANKELILRQINTYNPEIIFYACDPNCCLVAKDLGFLEAGFKPIGDASYQIHEDGRRIVWVYHPSRPKYNGEEALGKYISEAMLAAQIES